MLPLIIFFLGASLILYCVLGGADFGAGIWECFKGQSHRREQEDVITHALGPVWEANHVWLILAVVILFNGFPLAYYHLSIAFHLPLTLMLIGIVLRGCAFTFRHYDAVQDEARRYYTFFFATSSVLTPIMLGMTAGGMMLGRVTTVPASYYEGYIFPWLSLFSFVIGLFLCGLFAFVAAVFLVGEAHVAPLRDLYRQRARWANIFAIILGLLVFPAAQFSGLPLSERFFTHPFAIACMLVSLMLIFPVHIALARERFMTARLLAGGHIGLILIGWFALQFPALMYVDGQAITIAAAAAPQISLQYLGYALLGGSLIIFPAMGYLFFVFKVKDASRNWRPGA